MRNLMNKKLIGVALCTYLLALCFSAQAQQPTKLPRIGYLGPPTSDSRTMAFRQGLRDLGYIEEKNLLVDYRYVAGNPNRYSECRRRARAPQGRSPCRRALSGDPRSQADDQDHPHRHGDDSGSGRDRDSRQLGATGRKYHRTRQADPRARWEAAGIAQRGRSIGLARRHHLGRRR